MAVRKGSLLVTTPCARLRFAGTGSSCTEEVVEEGEEEGLTSLVVLPEEEDVSLLVEEEPPEPERMADSGLELVDEDVPEPGVYGVAEDEELLSFPELGSVLELVVEEVLPEPGVYAVGDEEEEAPEPGVSGSELEIEPVSELDGSGLVTEPSPSVVDVVVSTPVPLPPAVEPPSPPSEVEPVPTPEVAPLFFPRLLMMLDIADKAPVPGTLLDVSPSVVVLLLLSLPPPVTLPSWKSFESPTLFSLCQPAP